MANRHKEFDEILAKEFKKLEFAQAYLIQFVEDEGLSVEERILKKLECAAHVECNTPDIRSNVSRVKDNKDPIGRDFASYKIVDLDETYPKYIRENKEKFSHLIKE